MNKYNNLTQEQKRTIIIVVVAVLLVVGGIFYTESKNKVDQDIKDVIVDGEVIEAGKGAEAEVDANKPVVASDPNKAKFDQALINASSATIAGNHVQSIVYLNQALTYKNSDVVYARLYEAYNRQGNTAEALKAINKAIELNSDYTDYWNTKIVFMDEKTNASYAELKAVYNAGLAKVDTTTKINLVTSFASVSGRGGQIDEAISLWEYAKNLYPARAAMYQAEIDALK